MTTSDVIRRGTFWMLVGQLAVSASNWLQFLAVARFTTLTATGRFALATAIAAPLVLAAAMNLRVAQVCDVAGRFNFRDYLRLRVIAVALAVVVAPLVVAGFFDRAMLLPVLALTAVRAVESVSDIVHGQFQIEERWHRIAGSMTARGVGGFIAFAVALRLSGSLETGLISLLVTCLLVLLLIDLPLSRPAFRTAGASAPRRTGILRLAMSALPLAFASLLASLVDALPKYLLERSAGPDALALLSAPLQVVLIGAVFVNTYAQSSTRPLAHAWADPAGGRFRRLVALLTLPAAGAGLVVLVVALAAGKPLLVRVFGPGYAAGSALFAVVALGAIFSYAAAVSAGAAVAAGRFRGLLVANALAVAVTAITGAALIPSHGAAGAAWVFVLAAAALAVLPLLAAFGVRRGGTARPRAAS